MGTIGIDFSACDEIIADLEALEQAIVEICNIDTVHMIHDRVRMIQKK